MNTVLAQECIRYNRLLAVMKKSLVEVQRALKGLVVMSAELEEMGTCCYNQRVPPAVRAGRAHVCVRASAGIVFVCVRVCVRVRAALGAFESRTRARGVAVLGACASVFVCVCVFLCSYANLLV
jgi:hypothetical protein